MTPLHPEIAAALPSMPPELREWALAHPDEANIQLAQLGGHYLAAGRAAPAPGERGFRAPLAVAYDPVEAATHALDTARALYGDAEVGQLFAMERRRLGLVDEGDVWEEDEESWEEEDGDEEHATAWRLYDLIPIPAVGVDGRPLPDAERARRAVETVMLAAETLDDAWTGARVSTGDPARGGSRAERDLDDDLDDEEEEEDAGRFTIPAWAAAGVLADAWTPDVRYRLSDLTRDEAARFIGAHHRTLPYLNTRGLRYALGLRYGTRLVAVATAGTPTGRWKRPEEILEVTRIAADGTVKGSASMLMARLIDLTRAPGGPALVVTYSLRSERGTTYRALREKGLRPTMLLPGKSAGGGGRRRSRDRASLPTEDKIRWEAGPRAGAARWELLDA